MMFAFLPTLCLSVVLHLVASRSPKEWPSLDSYNKDIDRHKSVADNIIDYILTGAAKGEVYRRLANMTDKFGSRLCGSETLEDSSITWLISLSWMV
uniref:Uncharacterized protein n=1 Tax=Arion vulgaris TaxID=1028688 RepID=A0A0B7BPN9_9EUPU